MAINQSAIKSEFLDFHNHAGEYTGLAVNNAPVYIQEKVATLWKNIVKKGFTSISPSSSTVESAADTLYIQLNAPDGGTGIYVFYSMAMATIGNGMSGYTTILPPIPLVLSAPIEDKDSACRILASQLVACAKTGVSMLNSPPNTMKSWE